jgi:glycosyltransferase involved in cell wall biosynthesis
MRIGIVVYGGVDRGGRQAVIPALLNLVARLARRHELHVFALAQDPEPSTYPLLGATVHNLAAMPAPPGLGMARAVPRLLTALRLAGPFDVLHAYMGVPAGAVAAVAARSVGVPLVVTFDGNELVALPEIGYGLGCTRRGRLLRRLIVLGAERITVCTGYMARLALRLGIPTELVPLGIDPAHVPAAPAVAPPGPPFRLLHVASLNRVKDQSTLLAALALVRAVEPAVHLDIVGADTLEGAIQAECSALGLRDTADGRVTFHGVLAADEVWPFFARAHLMVLPSRHEAAGVAVLEAAACGVPTVGTDVGYVSEWSARGAARAVPVGNPPALAAAILELLHDSGARQRMGQAARALAHARDADWTAARFEEVYRMVTERTPRALWVP